MTIAQVQKAARKILQKNRRLRALLMEKSVSTIEIETSLHDYDYNACFTVALSTSEPIDIIDTQSQTALLVNIQQSVEMHASDIANQLVSAASPLNMSMDIEFESVSRVSENDKFVESFRETELLRSDEQAEEDLGHESPLPNLLEHVSDCYCLEIESIPDQAQSSETECSVATNILASFRGHGDAEQTRAELDCLDTARSSLTREECSMHRHDSLSLWHRYGIAMISLWHCYDLAMTSLWSSKRLEISRSVSTFLKDILMRGNEKKKQTSFAFSRSSQLSNFASNCILTISFHYFFNCNVCNVFVTCFHKSQKDYISRDRNSSDVVDVDFSSSR